MTAIEYARILEYGDNFKLSNPSKKVNIKPVEPNVEKELYGIYDGYQYLAFETEEARDNYCENYTGSYIKKITLGYIGTYMEKDNIIKLDDKQETRFLSIVGNDLSYSYNENTGKWSTCRTCLGNLPKKINEIKENKQKVKAI